MTRFRSRAVDAPCLMRITMRHLPLLHLDTRFPIVYHPSAILIVFHLPIGIPYRFAIYDETPFTSLPPPFSRNSLANIASSFFANFTLRVIF